MKNFYITTPIYYVNDVPHIGHAYTSIIADIYARRLRQIGKNIWFLTGTDEHGQKIQKSAENKGRAPIDFCNEVSQKFLELSRDIGLTNDDFIRTTEPRHTKLVQEIWLKLAENGWIYKGSYAGYYSVRDEAFYDESELINGRAPTGADVAWHKEESYFFELSDFEEVLSEIYQENPGVVFPHSRLNEVKSFLKSGLKDLSISRTSLAWGVPVPNDEKHVVYVWLDALSNYITALGWPSAEKFDQFWKNTKNRRILHFIGKDILRFHAVYWPAFLIGLMYKKGDLRKAEITEFFKEFRVISHGWWMNEGQKISKSLGNVINPYDIIKEFGLDKFRYFLLKEVPFGGDGDYSRQAFISKTNADLANNIGNLTQRVMSFIFVNCEGKIPQYYGMFNLHRLMASDIEEKFDDFFFNFEPHKALDLVLEYAALANEFIDKEAPWKLKKEGDFKRMGEVLFTLSYAVFRIANLMLSFTPSSAEKMLEIFAERAHFAGAKIDEPKPIFLRV